ncbi:MAG: hypothetical protein IJW43_00600 [Clostridia bacterium]|nr:hypothetical protein [Clostridia bacterium]
MKKFRFQFNAYIVILLIITLLIGLTALGFNVYSMIEVPPFENVIKYIALAVICTLLVAFILLVLFNSNYALKKGKIVLTFGFIKTYYEIDKIVQFTIFEEGTSLVAYFSDQTYTRIVIKAQEFDKIIEQVKEINPKIIANSVEKGKN